MNGQDNVSRASLLFLLLLSLASGCAAHPENDQALRLEESTFEIRALQTRRLAAPSESAILAATVAVLQDLQFNIDRIEKPLGVVSASKVSNAAHAGERVGLFVLDVLCVAGGSGDCGFSAQAKEDQHLYLTIVVLPSLERSGEFTVRVTMQRVIFDTLHRVLVLEPIAAPGIYEEVFASLRRALFIETGAS
jgi:hypothetical protein